MSKYYGYEESSYSLAHYGVVGMKWKNRRARRLRYALDKVEDYRSNHSYRYDERKPDTREERRIQDNKDAKRRDYRSNHPYTNTEMKSRAIVDRDQASNDRHDKLKKEDERVRRLRSSGVTKPKRR